MFSVLKKQMTRSRLLQGGGNGSSSANQESISLNRSASSSSITSSWISFQHMLKMPFAYIVFAASSLPWMRTYL